MDEVNEAAAWRELEDAIGAALRRYAQAVTPDDAFAHDRRVHLAWLSAARRARRILRTAEAAAAAAAIEDGATYPMLADAAGIARQNAWKRYGPPLTSPPAPGRPGFPGWLHDGPLTGPPGVLVVFP